MKVVTQNENEIRLHYLLRVAIIALRENAYLMDNIVYDESECDALCLADDLENELNLITQP